MGEISPGSKEPNDDEIVPASELERLGISNIRSMTYRELKDHLEIKRRRGVVAEEEGEEARGLLSRELSKKVRPEDIDAAARAGQAEEDAEK